MFAPYWQSGSLDDFRPFVPGNDCVNSINSKDILVATLSGQHSRARRANFDSKERCIVHSERIFFTYLPTGASAVAQLPLGIYPVRFLQKVRLSAKQAFIEMLMRGQPVVRLNCASNLWLRQDVATKPTRPEIGQG